MIASSLCSLKGQSVVKGQIQGLVNDTIFVNVNCLDVVNNYTDTIITSTGYFHYSKSLTSPTILMIQAKDAFEYNPLSGNEYLPLSKRILCVVLPNDTVELNGKLNKDAITYRIKSALKLNDTIGERHHLKLANAIKRLYLERKMNSPTRDEKLMQEYLNFRKESSDLVLEEYIPKHPNQDYSAFLLIGLAKPGEYINLYEQLSYEVKNGILKEALDSRMILAKQKLGLIKTSQTIKNTIAPEFKLITIDGEQISLNDFKGKYIVLDFWGTWCIPCIKGLPDMKKYHQLYSSKVVFISIACKDNTNKVLELVNKFNLNWIQTMDQNSLENVAKKYQVNSFPTKIIVDNNGKVVDVFVGESTDFYGKLDYLFGTK